MGVNADSQRSFTSIWRARQFADELGVPYDIFLESAFEVSIRSGWKRLPHPNQLYGPKNRDRIIEAVATLWQDKLDNEFMTMASPEYRDESFKELGAQISHREWVIKRLKERPRAASLGRACFIDRTLPEEIAVQEFGQGRVDKAKEDVDIAGETARPLEPWSLTELFPSCLGVAAAFDGGSSLCIQCPLSKLCQQLEAHVRKQLLNKFKSDDPADNRRKRLLRRRVKKCRAKKARKAAAGGLNTGVI